MTSGGISSAFWAKEADISSPFLPFFYQISSSLAHIRIFSDRFKLLFLLIFVCKSANYTHEIRIIPNY
jgi:hypothetical protein